MTWFMACLGVGAFAGLMAGLLGVGGGLIIVPALAVLLAPLMPDATWLMHLAIGTSLATIVFTSLSSIYAHHRRGAVRWELVRALAPGIMLGAVLGGLLAKGIPNAGLRSLFGLFELAVALQLALGLKPKAHRGLPGPWGMGATGSVIGVISALLGIGGGTLSVPFLLWCRVAIKQAVATSAACGLPIAVAGGLGFVIAGWGQAGLPPYSLGFVHGPAFAGIVLSSVLFAPLGAALAHRLPMSVLRRLFALFLALVGLKMLLG